MGVFQVPSYIKPRSRIASWMLPMFYVEEERQEYISDLKEANPVLKSEIKYYTRYHKLTMAKDLEGRAERFKILPDVDSMVLISIENFIERSTNGKVYGVLKGSFNLMDASGEKLINEVYAMLRKDVRVMISPPLQWLVYIRKEKILTRLCWCLEITGEIIIRPYGLTGLLLEVDNVKLDRVNDYDMFVIKKNALVKQNLNNVWRSLVVSEELGEISSEFNQLPIETSSESSEESSEIGSVE